MADNLKTIDTVDPRPFKKLIMTLGELPTSFLESMTYYEMLAWFVDYLQNTIIPSVNNNAEALRELQSAFVTLKNYVDNYFDNLDIQEEINNKLDAMVEAGTLQEIIADYLNSKAVFGFDTVADMQSATNLINGSYAETLGFTTKGDEGGATYKIRELGVGETANNIDLISIHDNIVAELITEPIMTTRQFGSGTNTDVDVLTKALTACDKIILSDDLTIAPQQINISSNKVIDFNGHKITMSDNNNISWANLIRVSGGHLTLKNGEIDGNSEGQTVAVVTNNTGVLVENGSCTINNMLIHNCLYEGIVTNGDINLTVKNSEIYDNGRNDVAILSWTNAIFENCKFSGKITGKQNIANIDVEPYEATGLLGNLEIKNCVFEDNEKLENIQTYLNAVQDKLANILIENCTCHGRIVIGGDEGFKSNYTINNVTFVNVNDKPALHIKESSQGITVKATFRNCAYPVKFEQVNLWDINRYIDIDATISGTVTKGVEFVQPEGTMTDTYPLRNINIKLLGTNSIVGWKKLHNSKITTPPLYLTGDYTMVDTLFFSDIYVTSWSHYIDIDTMFNKSDNVNPSFTLHSNNNFTFRSTKLPIINSNIGNGGINMLNNCSVTLELHNHKSDSFIIDNINGIYTARTIS